MYACMWVLPMTSLTRIECWMVRGVLHPAALTAFTRTKILALVGSPVMVYLVFSVSPLLAGIHSSAVEPTEHHCLRPMVTH